MAASRRAWLGDEVVSLELEVVSLELELELEDEMEVLLLVLPPSPRTGGSGRRLVLGRAAGPLDRRRCGRKPAGPLCGCCLSRPAGGLRSGAGAGAGPAARRGDGGECVCVCMCVCVSA